MTALLLAALAAAAVGPFQHRTPGDVTPATVAALCRPGYAAAHRLVSDATKRDIYAAYGIRPSGRWRVSVKGVRYWQSDYEIDHRVSLELGGSNAPANLWPQSYRLRRYNATWKDALENRLHWLMCHGSPRLRPTSCRIGRVMLTEDQIREVWSGMLAAETRALYFGDWAGRYTRRKQWITGGSFFLSSGAAGTVLAHAPVWVPLILTTTTAAITAYAIAVGLDRRIATMAKLHSAWNQIAHDYDRLSRP